jgi:hypothetical protein
VPVAGRGAHVVLPLELPAGRSIFRLEATPGAEVVPGDGRTVSLYLTNWTLERIPAFREGIVPLTPLNGSAA